MSSRLVSMLGDRRAHAHAGVVDEHVQAAEPLAVAPRRPGCTASSSAELAGDDLDLVAVGAQLLGGRLELLGRRAATVSPWPSCPSMCAMASPIPLEAPVTIAARSAIGSPPPRDAWCRRGIQSSARERAAICAAVTDASDRGAGARRRAGARSGGRAGGERRTTPIELLWDLVFVFTIAQVPTLYSHNRQMEGSRGGDARPGPGVVGVVGVRVGGQRQGGAIEDAPRLPAGGDRAGYFIVGLAVPRAFGRNSLLFAVAYAAVRFLHLGATPTRRGGATRGAAAILGFALTVVIGMVLLIVGAVLHGPGARGALAAGARHRLCGAGLADPRAPARARSRWPSPTSPGASWAFVIICIGEIDRRRWAWAWAPAPSARSPPPSSRIWPSAAAAAPRWGCGGPTSTAPRTVPRRGGRAHRAARVPVP